VSWAAFGLVVGAIAGAVKGGGWVGLAGGALLVGLVWGLFGLFAGALYGLWAGRAVSARRLNGIANLFPLGTSSVLAWVDGAATDDLRPPAAPGGQQLVLRLVGRPDGTVLAVGWSAALRIRPPDWVRGREASRRDLRS
jgi:hypothetical protein